MGQNNVMLKEQIARSEQYLDRVRVDSARDTLRSAGVIDGPVKL